MQAELLEKIEQHLAITGVAATRFGRAAVGDPRFVEDLRAGRVPRRRTIAKVETFLGRPV